MSRFSLRKSLLINVFTYFFAFICFFAESKSRNNCTSHHHFSYFQLLQQADEGIIAHNFSYCNAAKEHDQETSQNLCKVQYLREFLPPPTAVEESTTFCDKILSSYIDQWVNLNTKKIPYGVGFQKVSLGKFIHYNSLMEYKFFSGEKGSPIIDITMNSFSWTVTMQECTGEFANWNCGFRKLPANFSDTEGFEKSSIQSKYQNLITIIMSHRTTKRNHVIQLLLFGKLLQLITDPSSIVESFLLKHLKIVEGSNHSFASSAGLSCVESACKVNSLEDFYKFVHGSEEFAVSMHVRGGDSCDVMSSTNEPEITEFIINDKRPCFTTDVYMRKLSVMRKLYGVRVVFLATDSLEMIERTKTEPDYTWVYVDLDRTHFNKKRGFIECRDPSDDRLTFFSAIADIFLLQHGSFFIGTFTSIYSKLMYYRMIGFKMRLLPFISLDYPISCEAYEKCSTADIEKRFSTVEAMILHSQDCESYPGDLCRLKFDGSDAAAVPARSAASKELTAQYPDGSLLKMAKSREIYYMENGYKRSIPDWDYFLCRKFDIKKVIVVSDSVFQSIPTGDPLTI